MKDVISAENIAIDGLKRTTTLYTDGSKSEATFGREGNLIGLKECSPQGEMTKTSYNNGQKTEEILPDGSASRWYLNGQMESQSFPDGSKNSWYENGNKSSMVLKDGSQTNWYRTGEKSSYKSSQGEETGWFPSGIIQYKISKNEIYINPDYYTTYKIGIKDNSAENHWSEKFTLDPQKKTILCLGGDQTKDERAANGNINAFINILGLKTSDDLQLCSCYRPGDYFQSKRFGYHKTNKSYLDMKREVLKTFIPFLAQKSPQGTLEKLPEEKACANMQNLLIISHCLGSRDVEKINDILKELMTELNYPSKEQKHILKQVLVTTNNSQQDFNKKLGFTTIHRYSVTDGQSDPEYDLKTSDCYGRFLKTNEEFKHPEGDNKTAFVVKSPNESLWIFDKILLKGNEHNSAFWTTNDNALTENGQKQAQLMQNLGQFFYHNHQEVPDIKTLMIQLVSTQELKYFVYAGLDKGKELDRKQKSILENQYKIEALSAMLKQRGVKGERIEKLEKVIKSVQKKNDNLPKIKER